jgi:hypothetical protein
VDNGAALAKGPGWQERLKDGPLDPDFWLGSIEARLPALFRAGLGSILFVDALMTSSELYELYGSTGVWPAKLGSGPLSGISDQGLLLVWILGLLALLAFALGLLARVSAALSWVFLNLVHHRNPGITTGGDFLAQILVFFCIWLDTSAALSLDALWFKKRRKLVPAGAFRAMQVHVAVLYFVTARLKVRGGWLEGDGIFLSLQHLGFLRPPGSLLLEHPALCKLSTYAVLSLEAAFPVLALFPINATKVRLGAIFCGVAVQLGILLTMRVGSFTLLMLWICVLYLPAETGARSEIALERALRIAVTAGCMAVVTLLEWGAFIGRRFPLPRPIESAQAALGLTQPFDLFGRTYEVAQWYARGRTAAGREVDVLQGSAPGLRSVVGWRFSTLYKVTFAPNADYPAIASLLCRKQQERDEPLESIVLGKHAREPVHPGQDTPWQDVELYAGSCLAARDTK